MFLNTGFNFFAKTKGGNYVFHCSSHVNFNPQVILIALFLKENILLKKQAN